jgi:serine/threonine protein kinase
MGKERTTFGFQPEQLGQLLSICARGSDSLDGVDREQAAADFLQSWLGSPFREDSPLLAPLLEILRSIGKNLEVVYGKSLVQVLLDSKSEPSVLKSIKDFARDRFVAGRTELENAVSATIYYTVIARLLVSYDHKVVQYTYKELTDSFSDLIAKKWMTSDLRRLFSQACEVCKHRRDVEGIARESPQDEELPQRIDQPSRSKPASASPAGSSDMLVNGVGSWVGSYKLLRVLGEGGMGIVYLAEQKHPIRRQVALKIIKPGMDSKRVIARFEAERQALALLDHPNIAHVYDAGTTENGRPYFVMEYVKGLSITEHCDHHRLTIEDRLNLFRQVCLAVHHAHQKGIIHRDIKPSNILISTQDDEAVPKIIDFGVAKALAQPLTERTLVTEHGQLFGTPEYMSPEQADTANEDIDTRSDIYSLGVMLYVLLTGVLPFDSDTLRTGGIEHIRQVIRETDPKTPSTRLTSLGEEAKKVAQSRRTEIATLAKKLHKELEWIPLKAMRKERAERYRSASEFVDDIDNYLKGAPLLAGPPSMVYRLKKFIRRNRALVTGVAVVLTVLVVGIIVSMLFAIGQARARAEARAVVDFLTNDVLTSADPARAKRWEVTLSQVLDVASENLEVKFEGKPLVEASIRHMLGKTYLTVGRYDEAEPHIKRTHQICQEQLGEEHPDTLSSCASLALLYLRQGRYMEAEPLFRETLNSRMRILGEKHLDTIASTYWLGVQYWYQGRYDEAQPLFEKVVELRSRILGEDHSETLISLHSLAGTYRCLGCYDEAESLLNKGLETAKREIGEEHPITLETMRNLVLIWIAQGLFENAEPLAIKTLNVRRLVLGEEHPDTLESMTDLAVVYGKLGRYEQAVPLSYKALDTQSRVLGEAHWWTLITMHSVAVLCMDQDRYEEAESWFKKVWTIRRQVLGEQHPHTLESVNGLAVLYKEQARYDEAEKLLLHVIEGRRLKLGDTHPHTLESWNKLIELYEVWGKPEKAEEWRAKLPQTRTVEQ